MTDHIRTYANVIELRSDPPTFLDEVLPESAWSPVQNDFEWWGIISDYEMPDYKEWSTREQGGRLSEIRVETFGKSMEGWCEAVAQAIPAMEVTLRVDDGPAILWKGGERQ